MDASPSRINPAARSHFVGAEPVKAGLRVGSVLTGKQSHPRVVHHEPVGRGRYLYRGVLTKTLDVDAEWLAWLREAWTVNVGRR